MAGCWGSGVAGLTPLVSSTRAHHSAALSFSEALKPQAAAVGVRKTEVREHPPLGGEALKPQATRSDWLLPSAVQITIGFHL